MDGVLKRFQEQFDEFLDNSNTKIADAQQRLDTMISDLEKTSAESDDRVRWLRSLRVCFNCGRLSLAEARYCDACGALLKYSVAVSR
jgi:hypothetical protein